MPKEITPEMETKIQEYIKEMGFTWTIKTVKEMYEQYKQGFYVSFTARQIIKNVIEKK